MMDWRKILKAYLGHVCEEEGTYFLPEDLYGLTKEENAALAEVLLECDCTGEFRGRVQRFIEERKQ